MNKETATDKLYEATVNLTAKMYPGADLNDPKNDVGITQKHDDSTDPQTPYITTHDGLVEAWAFDRGAGRGLRTRFALTVIPVFDGDVGDELEFSTAEMAAKAILCLHLQMRLAATSVSWANFPATWPNKKKGKAHKASHETMISQ